MRYLITANDGFPPFLTNVFDYVNNWQEDCDMVVYDLQTITYTTDGTTWHPIETDQL